jgi:transposase
MHSRSAARRRHSAEFKAEVLAACELPGASVSAVALAHGLSANLAHKWRMTRGVKLASITRSVGAVLRNVCSNSAPERHLYSEVLL